MKESKTLNVRETALRLGCTQKFVRDLLYEQKLPGARKKIRQWRIPLAPVEQRLEEREARNA